MKKNKFRAELYKTYIASGLQDPVLIQEYIEIAESFVFYQKKLTKKAYDELVEIISKARMAGPKLIPVLGTVN